VDPAIEVARNIRNGLALAERGGSLRVIEEDHGATHALNAYVEGDARAQRRLFKNQRDEFAVQRRGVTNGPRLDVGREVEEFPRVRGAPLRSCEQIGRQRNRSEEHTSELQSLAYLVCRLLLEKKKKINSYK